MFKKRIKTADAVRFKDMRLEDILDDLRESAFFLHDRIEVNTRVGNDPCNDQPIHVAAYSGRIDYVEALLEAGAEINSQGDMDQTPLHYAVRRGDVDMVKLLLAHGASPHIVGGFSRSPLDDAIHGSTIHELLNKV